MKTILTLSFILLTIGCANSSAPVPPDIKVHYMLDVSPMAWPFEFSSSIENLGDIRSTKEDVVRCMKFDIVSLAPYKLHFDKEVSIQECHLSGGPKADDMKKLIEWIREVVDWADTKKKCLK